MLKKLLTYLILPALVAGIYVATNLPRIYTHPINHDEEIYIERKKLWQAFSSGDFQNPIWQSWDAYDQPPLTPYIYGIGLTGAENPLLRTRTIAVIATALTLAIMSIIASISIHPLAGLIAPIIAGKFTLLGELGVMGMIDPLLYFFYVLGLFFIIKKKNIAFAITLGLAVSAKFNAGSLLIIYSLANLKHPKSIIAAGLISFAIFISLNPYLWSNPIQNTLTMLESRTTALSNQERDNPTVSLTSPIMRARAIQTALVSGITYRQPKSLFPVVTGLFIASLFSIWLSRANSKIKLISLSLIVETSILLFNLPLNWDRYFLPLMPTLSIVVSSVLFTLPQSLKLLWKQRSPLIFSGLTFVTLMLLSPLTPIEWVILLITSILIVQGTISTLAMCYTFFEDKDIVTPQVDEPTTTFSLLVPAKNESQVIGDTIRAIDRIEYPKHLFDANILIPAEDIETILAAQKVINEIESQNIRIIELDGNTNTKSYSLNIGLHFAKHQVVGVFDAEDEPKPLILQRVNREFHAHPELGAVQASIQLTNINSSWFGPLNSLEYFFWFKSVLPFLAASNAGLIAGNTVFIKKEVLNQLEGWDEKCLTEDADLGVRLHQVGSQIGFIFDTATTTFEEVPHTINALIRQRARWDQGFMQVIHKTNWKKQLTTKQQMLLLYTLIQPLFRHIMLINMIILPIIVNQWSGSINTFISITSWIPAYFVIVQIIVNLYGLKTLKNLYQLKFSVSSYLLIPLLFYPYQMLLSLGSIRAIIRQIRGISQWDKTDHHNLHRLEYVQMDYT